VRRVVRSLTPLRRVAVYVSSHGFGHAVRVGEVLGKLAERRPDVTFQVCATAPRWVFPLADERLTLHERSTDVGMAQHHGLSIDFESTVARLDALEDEWEERASSEAIWLREVGAALVLGDIPPLAFDAARRAGVPAIALGNFSWDWIYRNYADRDPRFLRHADRAAQSYASASRLLRLPFHADMSVFRSIVDLPLVARRSPLGRAEARRAIGIETDGPLVLVGFGGLGFPGFDVSRLADMPNVQFVTTAKRTPSGASSRIISAIPGYGSVASRQCSP